MNQGDCRGVLETPAATSQGRLPDCKGSSKDQEEDSADQKTQLSLPEIDNMQQEAYRVLAVPDGMPTARSLRVEMETSVDNQTWKAQADQGRNQSNSG